MSAPLKALERPPFSMVTLSSPFASRYSPRVAPRPMASNRAFVSLMSPFELPRRPCAGGDFFDLTLMDKMTDTLTVKMPPELLARVNMAADFNGENRCEYVRRLIEADLADLEVKRRALNAMFGAAAPDSQ